jgi:hypothetical protein
MTIARSDEKMIKILASILVLAALLLVPVVAGAEDVPDLVGNWTGVHYGVRLGSSDYSPETSSEDLSYRDEGYFTLIIEEQNGQRFAGERISNANPENSEAILGVISFDNETVYMVDEDGYFDGKLISATEMELVYREVDPEGMIVSIGRYTKT